MMRIESYLILSAALLGIGTGAALYRGNIISIVMSIATAGAGALVAMATLDAAHGTHKDGMLFALCIGAVVMVYIVLGCALAYRRFMSSGATDVGEENRLRH